MTAAVRCIRALRALALAAAGALLVAGCAQDPSPPDVYYRLLDAGAPAPRAQPILDGTVMVTRFHAEGVLAQRPLAWVDGAAPQALQQRHYHFWNAAPPEMLQDLTADVLRARGVAPRVLVAGSGVEADYRISGRLRRFEQEVGDGGGAIAVSLELALYREQPRRLLLLERYDVREPVAEHGIDAAAAAINDVLLTILERFVADLAAR